MLNLDPSKDHGHDTIAIRMLQVYSPSICKQLEIICKLSFKNGDSFRKCWKYQNFVLICKKKYIKNRKQSVNNYCPVFLKQVIGKIFEHLLCNSVFEFFIRNDVI